MKPNEYDLLALQSPTGIGNSGYYQAKCAINDFLLASLSLEDFEVRSDALMKTVKHAIKHYRQELSEDDFALNRDSEKLWRLMREAMMEKSSEQAHAENKASL